MNSRSAAVASMYQDRLLAEYRAPKNRREMDEWSGRAERKNPTCGDAMAVMVRLAQLRSGQRVADVSFTGQGCSIAVASASLMTQVVQDGDVGDAVSTVAAIEAMLAGGDRAGVPALLEPLCAVAPFHARHQCALLPWLALKDALDSA